MSEVAALVWSWCGLALAGALFIGGLRIARPELFRRLWPSQRQRAVPWSGMEMALAMFLLIFVPPAVDQTLQDAHFYRHVYGADLPADGPANGGDLDKELARARHSIWAQSFAFPLQVVWVLALLHVLCGARPYQLGLTAARVPQNLVLGYRFWLVLTPTVLAVNLAAGELWKRWFPVEPEHPLFYLLRLGPHHGEWWVATFSAVVAAPCLEELFFRGLFQPWCTRRRWGGDVAIVAAFAIALLERSQPIGQGLHLGLSREGIRQTVIGAAPALFVLAMIPAYLFVEHWFWRWLPYPDVARGIYGTSLLFAAFHSAVWPSPVALFPLALGLGILAYRTQSLVGPILVHTLFNAVACVAMLLTALRPADPQPANGNAATSADRGPASVATSTAVPGASLPRRR